MRRLLIMGLLGLAACSNGTTKGQEAAPRAQQGTGRVEGRLTPFQGAGQQAPHARGGSAVPIWRELSNIATRPRGWMSPLGPSRTVHAMQEDVPVAGEVILRFDVPNLTPEQVIQRVAIPGYRVAHKGYASQYLHLVAFERAGPSALRVSAQDTHGLVEQLATRPGVRFAEPNRWVRPLATPDDPGFAFQWHYLALNLPAAWDVQEGNPGLVVAVIDTGIVPHPDLGDRILPGYDMISDAANAGDGDGRDSDPTDPGGDEPSGGSSWHGTHVAGTLGALTNNGRGVAGVTWAARILPVRVVGRQGGSTFDVAAAMEWAAGGTVPGVPPNPTPAKVINLSLGANTPPQQAYQEVIDERVEAAEAIFVVAAGNEAQDASLSSPCNQRLVICVGATSLVGRRSSYSNFGSDVTVMAPGGEMRQDLNGDGYPDGVLSTALNAALQPAYVFYEGTSMATPHVTGALALLASVKPDLTLDEARTLLTRSAVPAESCPEGCGAGIVNAQAALRLLQGGDTSAPPQLAVNTPGLFFLGDGTLPLFVYNEGGGELQVTASADGALASHLSFPKGDSVTVPALSARALSIAVTTSGLAAGDYSVPLVLSSEGGSVPVTVKLRVGARSAQDAIVVLAYQDAQGNWRSSPELTTVASAASGYRYALTVPAGTYVVTAAIDDNQDGTLFEEGERVGIWRNRDSVEPVTIRDGQTVLGIDFDLVPFMPVGASQ
ncbi:S8 family peptidase [Myxococcaceae bacterium JPH2]|nr:S8 family peptidase [Myxococcaceae bacterium JPH2]